MCNKIFSDMESVSRKPPLKVRFSQSTDFNSHLKSAHCSQGKHDAISRNPTNSCARSISVEHQLVDVSRHGNKRVAQNDINPKMDSRPLSRVRSRSDGSWESDNILHEESCVDYFGNTSSNRTDRFFDIDLSLPEDRRGGGGQCRRPSNTTIMTIDEYRDMLHETQRRTLAEWMQGKKTGSPHHGTRQSPHGSLTSLQSPDRPNYRDFATQHVESDQFGRHEYDDEYVTLRKHRDTMQQNNAYTNDVIPTSPPVDHGHYNRRYKTLTNRVTSLSALPVHGLQHSRPVVMDLEHSQDDEHVNTSCMGITSEDGKNLLEGEWDELTSEDKLEENNNHIPHQSDNERLRHKDGQSTPPAILNMTIKQCNDTYGLVSIEVQDTSAHRMDNSVETYNDNFDPKGRPSTWDTSETSDLTDTVFVEEKSDSDSGPDSADREEEGAQSQSDNDDCDDYSSLGHVDIVGESFEARFPWQRDAATQCEVPGGGMTRNRKNCSIDNVRNKRSYSTRSDTSPAKKSMAFKSNRPHSMGHIDLKAHQDELMRISEEQNLRRLGLVDSVHGSFSRRRNPLLVISDDIGSASDLESIQEDDRSSSNRDSLENVLPFPNGGRVPNDGVLASPRVSPEMWRNIPDVVVNADDGLSSVYRDRSLTEGSLSSAFLSVPRKHVRRRSIGSVNSGSDESDQEPSPAVARRGRRAAIVDTKNFGDVSPEASPSNSCDEGDPGTNIAGRMRRRRSSIDLATNAYPGDLLVQEHHKRLIKRNTISDFYANRNGSTPVLNEENKKQRQTFSLLKLMKTRSKESLSQLEDILQKMKMKPSEFKDNHLAYYKTVHWTDLVAGSEKQGTPGIVETLNISDIERKRRESVWELFKSECVFLIDHLMVLKHCFLEPLKKLQVEGFLMYAEPLEIFSNLDELCYVSYTFCKDFIAGLVKDMSATDFGRTSVLIKALQRYSTHSKDASVYHTYCLNYSNALSYLEKLRKNDEFCDFEKWCEQDCRCNRLQLADLLISPMQHCTKLPLLLQNIKKYTQDPVEKQQIIDSLEKVELSLKQLEDKMKWLKNFERVQDIQRHLVWPTVTDLDSRAFIPEYLKSKLLRQPCERLLACPSRQLLHEGPITLTESAKSYDAHIFLFDDILLIAKAKKAHRKKNSNDGTSSGAPLDRQTFTVHRQPLPLDRLGIHDVTNQEAAANGLKHALVIVQISRFQQIIDVFTLQAASETSKNTWIIHIREAKSRYCLHASGQVNCSSDAGDEERDTVSITTTKSDYRPDDNRNRRSSSTKQGKSHSIDAVFL